MAHDCRSLKPEDCLIQVAVWDFEASGKILPEMVIYGTAQFSSITLRFDDIFL